MNAAAEGRRELLVGALGTGIAIWLLCFTEPSIIQSIDHQFFHQPHFRFLLDALQRGELPWWNPYIGLGRPFLGDLQNAVFYPPVYLLLLGETAGLFLLLWGHGFLAVWGMRRLAAQLGATGRAGWVAGSVFGLSGVMTAHLLVGHMLYFAAACYMPWIFLHTLRLDNGWDRSAGARHALLMGLQLLCGHPQVFWLTTIAQGIFLLGVNLTTPWHQSMRHALQTGARFASVTLWALAVAAVVLLPFFELIQFANRGGATNAFITHDSMQWAHLKSLLVSTAGSRRAHEFNWFLGPLLALAGLAGLSRWRDRNSRGLLVVTAFAVLLALGDSTPFFHVFKTALPGFTSFRLHARAGLLVAFALILGAATAWIVLRARFSRHPALRLTEPAVLTLLLVPLLWNVAHAKREYTLASFMALVPPPPFAAQMAARSIGEAGQTGGPASAPPRLAFPWGTVIPNHGMIHRYAECDAYTSLFLQRPWDCLHVLARVPPPDLDRTALSVRIFSDTAFPFPGVAQQFGYDAKSRVVLTNTSPEPRAWLAAAATGPLAYSEILVRLQNGHDQHGSPLVEDAFAPALPAAPVPPEPARILSFRANEITVELGAGRAGLLVLAEAWHPGWKAEIGGAIVEAIPANGWMRAFPVPAGQREVRVFYEQNFIWQGAAISVTALVAIMRLGFRRRPQPPAGPLAG